MAARVTIQDIADALGVSRNTVSKAINNTGVLAEATRERVLKKAAEMGYKQFSYININGPGNQNPQLSPARSKEVREISLLSIGFIGDSHFASTMIDKFQNEISRLGFSLAIHRILPDDLENLRLPNSFDPARTAGIICVETFHYEYANMLCGLGIPILFVDTPVLGVKAPLKADRLYMDNRSGIISFVNEMARRGLTRIGFIGEYDYCQSFFERYMAYRDALYLLNLPDMEHYCICEYKRKIKRDDSAYRGYLMKSFRKMKKLPDVFICANDFIAFDVLYVFQQLGISVPEDVYLCGFDDSPGAKISSPQLTTIHIHSQIMGFSATQLLISRIKEPSLNFRAVYTETNLIYRRSTGD